MIGIGWQELLIIASMCGCVTTAGIVVITLVVLAANQKPKDDSEEVR